MRYPHRSPRHGFTFIEVLTAVVILTIALLAITASAAVATRHIVDATRESRAATIAQHHAEQAFASPCTTDSGIDSIIGAIVTWSNTGTSGQTTVHQTTTHKTRLGPRIERYTFTGACH